uniref:NADH-ubiquinone oxidoreductase chain 3 n=1 Tax=Pseudorhabdosynochus yangjiangensis TaxID=1131907 RepID=A0A3G0WUM1_9PLAT|nr:NADH dehydrogenase subunit 3 [Pseudorhabdosynochus yangjiangensis]
MGVLVILICIFLILGLLLIYNSFWFGGNYSNDNNLVWINSFECGFLGENSIIDSFSINFFILLVFFVIFDLEISLLLNIPYQLINFKSLIYYSVFVIILVVGYLVETYKGFITWEE